MKLKKKSGLMGAVIALSCASLVSVGFASWVISQGDTKTVNGSFDVETVNDNRHEITISNLQNAVIKYGAPTEAEINTYLTNHPAVTGDKLWLTSDAYGFESLIVTFNVSVTNVDSDFAPAADMTWTVQAGTLVESVFTPEEGNSAGYAKCNAANLVAALPTVSHDGDFSFSALALSEVKDNGKYDATFTVRVMFDWGTAFGSTNPYYYYNDGTKTAAANGNDAQSKLSALEADLDGVQYRLTVSIAA